MSFLTPVWSYVDALVHPAALQDALTLMRHRAFIAPRLIGSLGAIAGLPVYIADRGVPTTLEVGVPERARGIGMTANIQVKKSA